MVGSDKRHVFQNVTTIESLEKTRYVHNFVNNYTRRRSSNDRVNAFDIGRRQNWEQVMGGDPWKWFIPVLNSPGNGLAFPVNEDVRSMLRGMRSNLGSIDGSTLEDEEEDNRVWRRDGPGGRWMMHD